MFCHNKFYSTSEMIDIVEMRKGVSADTSGLCKKVWRVLFKTDQLKSRVEHDLGDGKQ